MSDLVDAINERRGKTTPPKKRRAPGRPRIHPKKDPNAPKGKAGRPKGSKSKPKPPPDEKIRKLDIGYGEVDVYYEDENSRPLRTFRTLFGKVISDSSVFDDESLKIYVAVYGQTNKHTSAAVAAGISPSYAKSLRKKYPQIQDMCIQARGMHRDKLYGIIEKAADNGDWRAAQTLLKTFDKDFNATQEKEVEEDNKPKTVLRVPLLMKDENETLQVIEDDEQEVVVETKKREDTYVSE